MNLASAQRELQSQSVQVLNLNHDVLDLEKTASHASAPEDKKIQALDVAASQHLQKLPVPSLVVRGNYNNISFPN